MVSINFFSLCQVVHRRQVHETYQDKPKVGVAYSGLLQYSPNPKIQGLARDLRGGGLRPPARGTTDVVHCDLFKYE